MNDDNPAGEVRPRSTENRSNAPRTRAHEPGVGSLDPAPRFRCRLSMPKALLCRSETPKLSSSEPAYGECPLRLKGDNGKPNDNMLMHILSPYPQDTAVPSRLHQAQSLRVRRRRAIVIVGYGYAVCLWSPRSSRSRALLPTSWT